jgi:hypothetical protein
MTRLTGFEGVDMPIIDVELVCESEAEFGVVSATDLANAIGDALQSPPGRTWVRLRFLGRASYEKNHVEVAEKALPTFATMLHARPAVEAALASEVSALRMPWLRSSGARNSGCTSNTLRPQLDARRSGVNSSSNAGVKRTFNCM